MCVHIAQLMTHPAIYTLPFTLQLCYKPLEILQRVTKSQKVHISIHDGLQNLHNIKLALHRSQGFLLYTKLQTISQFISYAKPSFTKPYVQVEIIRRKLQAYEDRRGERGIIPTSYFISSFWYSPFNIFSPFFRSDL